MNMTSTFFQALESCEKPPILGQLLERAAHIGLDWIDLVMLGKKMQG
jgi:hypothetical protein